MFRKSRRSFKNPFVQRKRVNALVKGFVVMVLVEEVLDFNALY